VEVNEMSPAFEPVAIAAQTVGAERLEAFVIASYERHEAEIHGLLLAVTRDPEAAADLTQEAFVRLIEQLRRGRTPDNVGGWLYRTASNLAISRGRRATVARRLAPRLVRRDEPATPDRIVLDRERNRALDAALGQLPVADRIALVMAAQGLSGEEIAAHLGMRHGALRTRLLRARARLRETLERGEAAR